MDVEHAGGNNSQTFLLQQGSNELGQMQVPFGQFVSWQRFFTGALLGLLAIGFPLRPYFWGLFVGSLFLKIFSTVLVHGRFPNVNRTPKKTFCNPKKKKLFFWDY